MPDLGGAAEGDEAVAVADSRGTGLDLAGYTLADGEGAWTFPAGSRAGPGEVAWIVGNATAWAERGGAAPMAAWQGAGVPRLGNGGDDVLLLDPAGHVVDAFAYGDGATAGMAGSVGYTSPDLVYTRLREGGLWRDTDDAGDWRTPRPHRVGESDLGAPTFMVEALTLYASPDSSFSVLRQMLASAEARVQLHVYELRSHALADLLVDAKARRPDLDLRVLVEDRPVGQEHRERSETAGQLQRIIDAGGDAVLAQRGRYAYHHLKVLVVDDAVAVQSENWVPSGVPKDPSWGNRGWGVVVHDADVADWMAAWMAADRTAWDAHAFDLASFDPLYDPQPRFHARAGEYGPVVPAQRIEGRFLLRPVVGPDAVHDPRHDPVAALVRSAERRVLAQQLDLSTESGNPLGWRGDDALLAALAATSAADVRVLAAAPFSADDTGNEVAIGWLGGQASGIDARLLDRPGIATLHNKGLVVDDAVVVGSINGNHHSRSMNREAALIVHAPEAAAYFAALFESDWAGAPSPRDPRVIPDDLEAMPSALWPSLLVVALLAAARRR